MTRHRTLATRALVIVVLVGLPSPATAQGVSGARAPIAAEPGPIPGVGASVHAPIDTQIHA